MCAVRGERESVLGVPVLRDLASPRTKRTGTMFNGFIAVRRGLLEHLRRGKLTELEALTFIIILGLANPYTGIWFGSAKSLWGEYPFYGNERRARRALEGLASKWYIRRLSTPGKHSNYPILIDKYEVKVGEKVGLRLNAHKSKNERSLCYEKIGTRQGEGELGVIHGGEHMVKDVVFTGMPTPQKAASSPPLLKKEKETEKKKKKTHKPVCRLFEIWNEYRGELPEALKLTAERERKCKARLKTHEADEAKFLADFQMAVHRAAKTPFLLGQSTRGWKASFDWIIANDTNYLAILEGKYDSKAGKEDHSESAVGRSPRTEGKPGKCSMCGTETAPGFSKCYACTKKKAPVNP